MNLSERSVFLDLISVVNFQRDSLAVQTKRQFLAIFLTFLTEFGYAWGNKFK